MANFINAALGHYQSLRQDRDALCILPIIARSHERKMWAGESSNSPDPIFDLFAERTVIWIALEFENGGAKGPGEASPTLCPFAENLGCPARGPKASLFAGFKNRFTVGICQQPGAASQVRAEGIWV